MNNIDTSEFKPTSQAHLREQRAQNKELGAISSTPPSLVLLRRTIEEGAVQKNPGLISGIQVDREKVLGLTRELSGEFEALEDREKNSQASIILPDEFNWGNETKNNIKAVMRMMLKTGLVNTELMRAASRFASPGNTLIKEQKNSHFNRGGYLLKYWNDMNWDPNKIIEDPVPLPTDKYERNRLFSLDIGKGYVVFAAGDYMTQAKRLGISLSEEQAVKIALFTSAAHEFAHAVDHALAALGIRTKDRALRIGLVPYDLTDKEREDIHQEHFARGIEDIMIRQYLIDQGWSENDVDAMIKNIIEYDQPEADQAKQLIFYAREQHYTADELKEIQRQLSDYVLLATNNNYPIRSIKDYLSYRDAPYNETQIRELMA